MDGETKKQRERNIFNLIYGNALFTDVMDKECPDFLVRLSENSPCFGVEVTEFYHSETSARLDRISDYSLQLLDGGNVKHKDDRNALHVVDIVKEDNSIHAKDVPAIIQRVPPLSECSRLVAQRILSKTQLIKNTTAEISHANLIIHDKTGLLRVIKIADFYRIYFSPELISALSITSFREVFLITDIEDQQVYARLKMLLLLASAYLFNDVIVSNGIAERMGADVDEVELFASYFASTVEGQVLVHHDKDGSEVIFGDSGLLIAQDGSITVRLHSDRPIYPSATPPVLPWKSLLGTDFHEIMTEYRKSSKFSSEAVFSVIPRLSRNLSRR